MTTIPIQNIYYLLSYAWNKLDEAKYLGLEIAGHTKLPDLFARMLVNAAKILLKRGLYKSYVEHNEEIPGVRGKLQLASTVKRGLHIRQSTVCTYDEYSANILANRILITTLYRLRNTAELDKTLKAEIAKIQRLLPIIQQINLSREYLAFAIRNRPNKLMQFVLHVCWLVFENCFPSETPGHWVFRDFTRDERQMSKLFEAFIRRFYQIELQKQYIVQGQDIDWKFNSGQDFKDYLPRMRTDVTIENELTRIIIDAKFYPETMNFYHDTEKIKSGNLYQLFAYLLNQEDGSERSMTAKGILLYPTVEQEYDLTYSYNKHSIYIKTVNLNKAWTVIAQRLIEIVS